MLEQREGGCDCGRIRFQAEVDLDLLSQCSCFGGGIVRHVNHPYCALVSG